MQDYVTGKILYCHSPPPPPQEVNGRKWENEFLQETFVTALNREKKLRDKLGMKIIMNQDDKNRKLSRVPAVEVEERDDDNNNNNQKQDFVDDDDLDILD